MESLFRKININTLTENYFKILNEDWALLTAGNIDKVNTMTISWGTVGVLWNKPVFFAFVRPQRYTFDFINRNHYFTISFFEEEYKKALDYCGKHSGRDNDKIKNSGLTSHPTDLGNVIFEQARIALECKKLYVDTIKPEGFIDPSIIRSTYQNNDFHSMFIGEIITCYKAI